VVWEHWDFSAVAASAETLSQIVTVCSAHRVVDRRATQRENP
jgi:hypothetical protein